MTFFPYGKEEIEYLSKRDEQLGTAIEQIGMIKRQIIPDPFTALIFNVVSQQISKKAAETVWNRLKNKLQIITPETIDHTELLEIQKCGLGIRKAKYIKGIAAAAQSGEVDFGSLHMLTDDEIIKKLSSLDGVGAWTGEMMLIFSFSRPDVVSFKDLAIRKGMMILYDLSQLSQEKFQQYRERYSPYGTVASLYLWEISRRDVETNGKTVRN